MSKLTKTHITALHKVREALSWGTKMNGEPVFLCDRNQIKWNKAKKLIEVALELLEEIE